MRFFEQKQSLFRLVNKSETARDSLAAYGPPGGLRRVQTPGDEVRRELAIEGFEAREQNRILASEQRLGQSISPWC
jgi:hypothetical protein